MSDIFISYASEDRESAKMLAHALESQGWSVWWDRKIPFGKIYDEVIADNLAAAHCVIVIWTRHSVRSRWVRTEASEAFERNALIPILMDAETKIPLQFKLLQTANLFGWNPGDVMHPEFERLLAHINELHVAPLHKPNSEPNQPNNLTATSPAKTRYNDKKFKSRRKSLLILGAIISLSLLACGVTYAMINWRVPTRIQADLIVDRIDLTVGNATTLPRIDFIFARFEHFSQLTFSPKKLEVIATAPPKNKNDHAQFIKSLQDSNQVIWRGQQNRFSTISIHPLTEGNKQTGSLESIRVKPGTTITFDASDSSSHSFTLLFTRTELQLAPNIVPTGPFKLSAENVFNQSGTPVKFNKDQYFDMRVELDNDNPFVKLVSEANAFTATMTLINTPSDELLVERDTPVSKIEFLKQDQSGEFESTLIQTGKVTYTDSPNIAPVIIEPHHFLALDSLNDATMQELRYDPTQNGFVLRLAGEAGKIVSRSGQLTKDHRLTLMDKLWHDRQPVIIFSIVLWICIVILGAYKIYQETKKHA